MSLTSSPLLFSTSRKSKRLSSYSPVLPVSARDEGSGAATATLLFKLGICGERIVWSEWLYGCRERYLLESGTNTATDQPLGIMVEFDGLTATLALHGHLYLTPLDKITMGASFRCHCPLQFQRG